MLKKIWLLIPIAIAIFLLVWYFIIKTHDYTIKFETKAIPGEIAYQLDAPNFDKMQVIHTQVSANFYEIDQKASYRGETYMLNWEVSPKNDSVHTVRVGITNANNSFKDRWLLLIGQNKFQKEFKKEIQFFRKALTTSLELYKVKIEGATTSPQGICACISSEGKIDEKALAMMKTIDILTNYILDHRLETRGRPRILVNSWNKATKQIKFNFCFPIAKMEKYPKHALIDIKNIASRKSLKASFYGHYMFSHFAWLNLMDYAEKNNINVRAKNILEVFQTNPQLGTDPLQWKAEIYLPLAQ